MHAHIKGCVLLAGLGWVASCVQAVKGRLREREGEGEGEGGLAERCNGDG
ncbi:hypothetical protein M758_1G323100 [Ceratodon purpureus]|nr:hypothetical protein M758_1G323100 [Ceratodon purpureus]